MEVVGCMLHVCVRFLEATFHHVWKTSEWVVISKTKDINRGSTRRIRLIINITVSDIHSATLRPRFVYRSVFLAEANSEVFRNSFSSSERVEFVWREEWEKPKWHHTNWMNRRWHTRVPRRAHRYMNTNSMVSLMTKPSMVADIYKGMWSSKGPSTFNNQICFHLFEELYRMSKQWRVTNAFLAS